MNFALLGEDSGLLSIVRALSAAGDRLTHAAHVGTLQAELMSAQPGVRIVARWEEIPVDGSVDAVLIAGSDDTVLEGARKLAAQDIPLLLWPSIAQGTQFVYELTLVRDDTHVLLFPAWRVRNDPCAARLKTAITSGELGSVLNIQLERELPLSSGSGGGTLSNEAIQAALLDDADLLRGLGGDYRRVTAVHTLSAGGDIAFATVTLAGDGLPGSTWTARPATGESTWKLRVVGDRGTAALERDVAADRMSLSLPNDRIDSPDSAAACQAIVSRFKSARDGTNGSDEWTGLTRVFETVDATRRSVARRRTIDLFHETQSERSLFKTQMTAIGCGILPLTLVAVVGLLIAGSILDPRDPAEADAEALGAILRVEEFQPGVARLTPTGEQHVAELAERLRNRTFAVLIEREPASVAGAEELNKERRQFVADQLDTLGRAGSGKHTDLVTLKGKAFGLVMRIARVLVFAPLFLFLALQALVWITKPSAARSESP